MTAAAKITHDSKEGRRASRRAALRWLKRALLAIVVLALAGLIVFAFLPKPIPVDMVEIERGDMQVTVDEDGRARVRDRYTVSAPISGRVARIELDAGDGVKEGTVLARIVPLEPPLLDARSKSTAEARVAAALAARGQTQAQIDRAKAALEFAADHSKRTEELVAGKAVGTRELDQARLSKRTAAAELESLRFGARVAEHELAMARAAIERRGKSGAGEQLDVPAPVDGRVLRLIQESEGVVQAGAPLLELGDPRALEIVVDVLTSDAVRIQPGARVTIDRWGGAPLPARVRKVEPSAFTRVSALGVEEQRVNVVIDLDAHEEALGDGYRVEAHIVVWEAAEVVRVPASAVFRHEAGWAVYRVEGGIARLTTVEIGQRNGKQVEIRRGLEPPATLVLHPSDRIRDGVAAVAR